MPETIFLGKFVETQRRLDIFTLSALNKQANFGKVFKVGGPLREQLDCAS